MTSVRMIFVTAPDETVALHLVRTLLEEGLIACGTIMPGLRSIYRWEGAIADEPEVQLILKTTQDVVEVLWARIAELHPYSCPEVLSVPVDDGHPDYLKWVADQVGIQE